LEREFVSIRYRGNENRGELRKTTTRGQPYTAETIIGTASYCIN
jgi:hypothetical protein